MSGMLHKIEEKLGMGNNKHEEKHEEVHRPGYKVPECGGGYGGHKEGFVDKIHGEGEKKKKKERKKHEDCHDYGSSSDSDSD